MKITKWSHVIIILSMHVALNFFIISRNISLGRFVREGNEGSKGILGTHLTLQRPFFHGLWFHAHHPLSLHHKYTQKYKHMVGPIISLLMGPTMCLFICEYLWWWEGWWDEHGIKTLPFRDWDYSVFEAYSVSLPSHKNFLQKIPTKQTNINMK